MKNPNYEERNSKSFAFFIIVALLMTILMRGVNTRMDVPHILYVTVAVLSGVLSSISFLGFVYCKMYKPVGSQIFLDMIKIILLGVMAYFTVAFSIAVITNL
jgi:hypothetical protein